MGSERSRTVRGPQTDQAREPVCPACGQPVGTAIQRRKILGAWVPIWRPLPCPNPDCERFGRTPREAGNLSHRRAAKKARRAKRRASRNEPGNSTKIG
nr:hypothetical protein [Streptomyces sp. TRM49041]